MRLSSIPLVVGLLFLNLFGCGPDVPFDGPTVDAFVGELVKEGKPVTFDGPVKLSLMHEKGERFDIPIQPDGSFKIGWMPIGKYSAMLAQEPIEKSGPKMYTIPGGLTIEDGKTEYRIDLGKGWK